MKSGIIEVLRFFKNAVNVSKNHSVRIGKEESSYIYRTRSKIKSPEKIAHCFFPLIIILQTSVCMHSADLNEFWMLSDLFELTF